MKERGKKTKETSKQKGEKKTDVDLWKNQDTQLENKHIEIHSEKRQV
jgi:hypothetical protein